jgi:CheY-like chemotaxis protein
VLKEEYMAKILVVDDSLFARLNICDILRGAGHETVEAENGAQGLKKVVDEKPECVLSDLLMPEMDGIAFLEALREREINLPVIVLSADIQETKRQKCIELGTAGFISKPPRKDEILALVARTLQTGNA